MKRVFALIVLLPVCAFAQLRVATWNISNYGGGRVSDIQNVVFATFQGRAMNPDALVCEEITSASAQTTLLNALNAAPGSSGTWAAAPFTDGNDTDMSFFYRTDRLSLVASTIIATGGSPPNQPRDTKRYDVRLLGYAVLQPKVAIYACHLKAGNTADDQSRRLTETTRIRTNAQGLVGFDGFMVVGDFNTYTSTDDSYQKLIGSEANNSGRFFDPISTPGSWDGNSTFTLVHTQDPATSAGMNSRFDFVLLCNSLRDGQGFDYLGNPNAPYSTLTWNDPAHSYRVWGNDGTSFGNPLTVAGNAMVGPTIAQAIKNAATSAGGHCPVFLDLRVPAESDVAPAAIDFGTVVQGNPATQSITVSNSADTLIWRTGIADLLYQLNASAGFGAPGGTFFDAPGGGGNSHLVSMDTSNVGIKSGTVIVVPTVPGGNARTVTLLGQVVPDELKAEALTGLRGIPISGGVAETWTSDNQYAVFRGKYETSPENKRIVQIELSATAPVPAVAQITLRLEAQCTTTVGHTTEAFDYTSQAFTPVDYRNVGVGDLAFEVPLTSPNRFIDPATHAMRLRITTSQGRFTTGVSSNYMLDKCVWILR